MQRSIAYQNALLGFLAILAFVPYVSLSSIHLFLPPLFGVLFFLFARALDRQDLGYAIVIALMLFIFEIDKGYVLFSSLIYFSLLYVIILPKLKQIIDCRWCLNLIYVLLAYVGYWLFMLLFHQVFLMPLPAIDWYIIYYIAIEFLLVSLL